MGFPRLLSIVFETAFYLGQKIEGEKKSLLYFSLFLHEQHYMNSLKRLLKNGVRSVGDSF